MTFTIESLGCAKNQVDSEELLAFLEQAGLFWVSEADSADVIIVNTCGFIASAKEESIQVSLELKERYPNKRVFMTGCLVQRYGADLERALTEIDGLAGLRDFPGLLRRILAQGTPPVVPPATPAPVRRRFLSFPGSVYVKVAEGCSNRCSYCAIPLIRGELVSRPQDEILEEIRQLLEGGAFELILIAQDLASFGLDRGRGELVALLERIRRLPGSFWVRLLYLHPDRLPGELLEVVAADPRFLPYFDLPFQHASSGVLERMGRQGSSAVYLELVRRIRRRLPDAVLRSTFLVGFPGESQEDFRELEAFQRSAELDWAGVFTYSREEGTAAAALRPRVPAAEARRRKQVLERTQEGITARRLERQVGRVLDVLIEEAVQGEGLYLGRAYLQAPEVDGLVVVKGAGLEPGGVVPVRMTGRRGVDLEGVQLHGP
ncbi:MAG: 30S ribosomal protein S12 methylthiotransferase RimO [Spirochaetales bacterium]|nr:30S ribosomal protein S12 methylthiotransferase RimO [Spirochaetales bacterium]